VCGSTVHQRSRVTVHKPRRYGETLEQLSIQLETAIGKAIEDKIFIDEINNGPDDRI
jgi:hypothetical protein